MKKINFLISLVIITIATMGIVNNYPKICWLLLAAGIIYFLVSVRPKKIKEKIPDS